MKNIHQLSNMLCSEVNVLLVQSNFSISHLISKRLARYCSRFLSVCSGIEALVELSKRDYDIVILNLTLSDTDALGLISKFQINGYTHKNIITYEGQVDLESEIFKNSGIFDVISLDAPINEFVSVLHKATSSIYAETLNLAKEDLVTFKDSGVCDLKICPEGTMDGLLLSKLNRSAEILSETIGKTELGENEIRVLAFELASFAECMKDNRDFSHLASSLLTLCRKMECDGVPELLKKQVVKYLFKDIIDYVVFIIQDVLVGKKMSNIGKNEYLCISNIFKLVRIIKKNKIVISTQKNSQIKEISKMLKEISNNLTVLHVEDESVVRSATSQILSSYFKNFVSCSSAMKGLELYKTNVFDIVITDLKLPKISGYQFIEQIKEINKKQKIVIFSAGAELQSLVKLINLGIAGYLEKPVNLNELLKLLFEISNEIFETKALENYYDSLDKTIKIVSAESNHAAETHTNTSVSTYENDFFDNYSDDGFFDDTGSDLIDMHSVKISAADFFANNHPDQYSIQDLIFASKELGEFPYYYNGLSSDYLDSVLNGLLMFIKFTKNIPEFQGIGYALEEFSTILSNMADYFDSNAENNSLCKQLVDAVILDLTTWSREVIIDKTAHDIHYLDASLLSSMSTMGMVANIQVNQTSLEVK